MQEPPTPSHRRAHPALQRAGQALSRQRNFWVLAGALLSSPAWADVAVVHQFGATTLFPNQTTQVQVILNNAGNAAQATGVGLTVPLANLNITNAQTTCAPGAVTIANSGGAGASLVLAGGSIAAGGTCEITATVSASAAGGYPSDIPVGAVTSSQGSNPRASAIALTVNGIKPLVGAKTFDKSTLRGGETAKVTVTVTNPNNLSFGALSVADQLPTQLKLAAPGSLATTCGAGTTAWNAPLNTAALTGGTIGPNTSCTFSFDVTPADPTAYLSLSAKNEIRGSSVSATDSHGNNVSAGGDFSASINVHTGAQIEKYFSANPVTDGQSSSFRLRVSNFNGTPLTGISFTDTVPAGITVTGTSGLCNGTGQSFWAASSFTLTNATLAADSSCEFTVNYTAANAGGAPILANNAPGTFTAPGGGPVIFGGNVVPRILGDEVTINPDPSHPGNGSGGLSATKRFAKSGTGALTQNLSAVQTETFDMFVTLTNASADAATGLSFTDDLTTMGAGYAVASASGTTAASSCAGTLTAVGTTIALSGVNLGAGATCTIRVPITVAANAARTTSTNRIGHGTTNSLTADINGTPHTWAGTDWASVTVAPALTVEKAFTPSTIATRDHATSSALAITIHRADGAAPFTGVDFVDAFPPAGAPLTVNTAPVSNTCGGTLSVTPQTGVAAGSIRLDGGSIAASSCTIVIAFTADQDATGSFTNSLASGSVQTAQGLQNHTAGSGTLTLDAKVATLGLSKRFSPILLGKLGDTSTLTIEISNLDGTPTQKGVALTDNLPFGMRVAAAPNQSTVNCGPSPVFAPVANASSVTLTDAQIEPGKTCTLQVNVTGNAVGNLINILPVGSITTDPFPGWPNGMTNTERAQATIQVPARDASGNPLAMDLAVAITNNAGSVCRNGTTTYTVTVTNPGGAPVAGATLTNTPPGGLVYGSWTVAATGGAVASATSGSGALNETVSLPPGGRLTYTITATVDAAAVGPLANTAQIQLPNGLVDAAPANNAQTDTDTVDAACAPPPPVSIPTLSEWGLIILSMLLAAFALRRMPLQPGRRS